MNSADASRPSRRRQVVFVLACGASFLLYLHRYTYNFVAERLTEEYGFSKLQIGTLGSLFDWAYGPLQIPSGIVADFFGPHLFLGSIMGLWSIALALHGVGGSMLGLGTARVLFGVGQAGCYPSLNHITQAWFPLTRRTAVQGWVATFCGRGGGAMSSVIFATVLMGWFGLSWRAALVVLSALGLVFAVVFLVLFRSDPVTDPHVNEAELAIINQGRLPPSKRRVLSWGQVLRNRSMLFFVIQQVTNAGADIVYVYFMGAYFLDVKHVDLEQAGLSVGLPLLGGAVGGMLGGYCNDWMIAWTGSRRWGRSLVGFTGKSVACVLMLVAISQDDPKRSAWALFAVKFFSDWSQPTVWGTCTDLGGKFSASVFGIINTAGTIGGIICAPLFGWVLDRFSDEQMVDGRMTMVAGARAYEALFTLVAAMYVASALCWFLIDCTQSLELEGGSPTSADEQGAQSSD